MTARPESAALEPLLEQLGLRQAAMVLPDWLDRAASQELSYADFLHGLLEEESVARANAATQKRLRQAGFPYAATIEQFDFRFRPELNRQVVLRYLDPTFVEQARTLALIGPRRPGRSDLAPRRGVLPQGTLVSTQRSVTRKRSGSRGSCVHQRHGRRTRGSAPRWWTGGRSALNSSAMVVAPSSTRLDEQLVIERVERLPDERLLAIDDVQRHAQA